MRYLIAFGLLWLGITAHAQDTVKRSFSHVVTGASMSTRLDTNELMYDEQGNALRYHQYQRLINSGNYTVRLTGPLGAPGTKKYLRKLTVQQQNAMYEPLRKSGAVKSPLLQEGSPLNIAPLLDVMTNTELNNKVVVLIFWHPECPPCTESFADINNFLKQIHNPEDLVVMAVTTAAKDAAVTKLKEKPLLYAQFIHNARTVYKAYQLNAYPSYIVTDKSHIIRFASTGSSSVTLPAFQSAVKAVLQQ
jgi:thiol-disulfide isomerase/thioredoxin